MKLKKIKFKAPTVITILVIILFLIWIMTLPSYFEQTGKILEKEGDKFIEKVMTITVTRLGILDILWAPFQGFRTRADFLGFIIILGVFMHLIIKSKAVEAGLGRIFVKFQNKEIWLIPITMVIVSFLGSIYGFAEETLVLYPVLIPMFLKARFDTLTVVLILVLGSIIGVAGSTVNPFAVGTANSAINDILGKSAINLSDGIIWRIAIWILLTILGIWFVMWYGKRVQKNNKLSFMAANLKQHHLHFKVDDINLNDLPVLNWRRKSILIILISAFLLMIVGSLPYDRWGFDGFVIFHNKYLQYGITKLWSPFGQWYFMEYAAIFLVASIVIGLLIMRESEKVFINSIYEGANEMMPFVIMLSLASGISVLLDQSKFAQWFGLFLQNQGIAKIKIYQYILIIAGVYTILSFLIVSTSSMALVTLPFIVPIATNVAPKNVTALLSATIIIFITIMAAISCITPTNIVSMIPLEKYQVPIKSYYKAMWLPAIVIYITGIGFAMATAYLS